MELCHKNFASKIRSYLVNYFSAYFSDVKVLSSIIILLKTYKKLQSSNIIKVSTPFSKIIFNIDTSFYIL